MGGPKRIVILGLGHIGASLAAKLHALGIRPLGWDIEKTAIDFCRKKKWIAQESVFEIKEPVLCLLATPESAVSERAFQDALSSLPRGSLVSDLFSSKGDASARLGRLCRRRGLDFAWSHPLAGREGRGARSADPSIFSDALVILDKNASEKCLLELTRFWKKLGCRIERQSTSEHQGAMAFGSHLMHAVAFALAHACHGRAGVSPSVLSATRVAKSDPRAWSAILQSNQKALQKSLKRFQSELKRVESLLADSRALEQYLSKAHANRMAMEETGAKK